VHVLSDVIEHRLARHRGGLDGAAQTMLTHLFVAMEAEVRAAPRGGGAAGVFLNFWRAFVKWLRGCLPKINGSSYSLSQVH
jgi:hypothetical protein